MKKPLSGGFFISGRPVADTAVQASGFPAFFSVILFSDKGTGKHCNLT
ncbi:MAG: hypothetical protein ACOY7J_09085 [Pseudomonadota bacterium]